MNSISPVKVWRNQKHIRELLNKEGEIVSWTMIQVPPEGFSSFAPYPVVLVKIGNKQRIGQLVDWQSEDLKEGIKVKAVLRRVREPDVEGVIPYGIKFKPV